jgi:Tetratricopeptide repeat
MSIGVVRALAAATCLLGLAGCESSSTISSLIRPVASPEAPASTSDVTATTPGAASETTAPEAAQAAAPADVTGTLLVPPPRKPAPEPPPLGPWSAAEDPMDDLSLGKRHFRESNYGLSELHFRRVVEREAVPPQRKAEAWVGLAASYDRLKRFDLADRAYKAAIAIVGLTPEVLNNQGYSYMLRGDFVRARAKFTQALERDPTNPYIQNNLELLEESIRSGGGRKKV